MCNTCREHLLEQLTGVRSSRRTYYSEYLENERRLDRAIASIADISAALCNTTRGVPPLVQAVVRVAVRHFDAEWAVIALNDQAGQRWMARRLRDGSIGLDTRGGSSVLDHTIGLVLDQQRVIIIDDPDGGRMLGAPMFLSDRVVGALVLTLSQYFVLDEREVSVLWTLANQAAVAVENARLYEESERLRSQATALYEEAVRQKTELEEKNRQLEKARRRLAVARQNEILNSERSRIARDLHDSVAQHLITIGMTLEWCRLQLDQQSQVHERICAAKEMARSTVTRMRETIFELATINGGQSSLVAALSELALDFEKTSSLRVQFRTTSAPPLLDAEIENGLYHIAQEALFNAYKHARASRVEIVMRFSPGAVRLVVADDGVGIANRLIRTSAPPSDSGGAHFGLRNMRERARSLGGTLRIVRPRRGGTEVRVTIPTEPINIADSR